ncbi:chymotrypsinogen B [Misgurnus anguillicaudatus]|uniref:chymotrypsinogen B n=1 Tax=Misgurnus anguillicaudatus TaxID=75329 RepID=UPI003CCFA588
MTSLLLLGWTQRKAEGDGILPWRWHVSIGLGAGHKCSGAVVHSTWILTSASCVYNLEERLLRFLTVKTGGSKKQTLNVIRIFKHPHFNSSSLNNNTALLQLSSPLNFDESTQAVCLPFVGQDIPSSLHCWTAVWTRQYSLD